MRRVLPLLLMLMLMCTTLGAAERRVLFGVFPNDGGYVIEPIVAIGGPIITLAGAISPAEWKAARPALLFRNGMRVGSVQAGEPRQLGCVSNAAAAIIAGTKPPDGEVLLATSFDVPSRSDRDRELTDAETQALMRYARAFLRNHDVADAATEELDVNARVMDAGGELLIVGSWSTPEVACAGSLFLIARVEDVTAEKLTPQVAQFRERADCQDAAYIEPLDHLDLDADGFDELISRDHQKEGYDYLVWRRDAKGAWTMVRGGGSGC